MVFTLKPILILSIVLPSNISFMKFQRNKTGRAITFCSCHGGILPARRHKKSIKKAFVLILNIEIDSGDDEEPLY